ncbi:MAG: hypothetical protein RL367_1226 [Pseudomonadota bacterium]
MKDRRALAIGIGLSILGHIAIIALIALLVRVKVPEKPKEQRIEVSLVQEVEPKPAVEHPAEEAPAPALAPEPQPEPAAPPEPAKPQPPKLQPRPDPVPVPKPLLKPPLAKPAPAKPPLAKPAPAKPQPVKPAPVKPVNRTVKPTGNLNGLNLGSGSKPGTAPPTPKPPLAPKPPSAPSMSVDQAKAAINVSLAGPVGAKFQKCLPPAAVEDNLIITKIVLTLTQDGGLSDVRMADQTGITDSNKPQAALFRQCALSAARSAAPFHNLPAEHYDLWKVWTMRLKKR